MIIPYKHMNLRYCALNISSEILKMLKRSPAIQVDTLRNRITDKLGENARYQFLPALSLLFLLGAIDCSGSMDEIILTSHSPASPKKQSHKRKGL